jgi:hypothetical protein
MGKISLKKDDFLVELSFDLFKNGSFYDYFNEK